MRKISRSTPIVALLAILALPACRKEVAGTVDANAPAAREFTVTGIVRAPLSDDQILIEHQTIPGFMPAMTMPFYVADAGEAAALVIGDRVRFRFVVGESSRADRFTVLGREESSQAVPPADSTTKRLKVGDLMPDFNLIDHLGHTVTPSQLEGRYTVVTFIFTRCPVPEFCPAITLKFGALQSRIKAVDALRAQVRLLGISLDPEFDRPDILRAYGEATGVDPVVWRLATGDTVTVDRLLRSFSVFTEKRAGTLDHTLCTALIGPDKRVREIWRGNGWKVDEVVAALEAAIAPVP